MLLGSTFPWVMVGDGRRVRTGVVLRDEDFGQSVEKVLLQVLPLLGLCVLSFFLLKRSLPKRVVLCLCLKWWVTKVAPKS